MKKEKPLDEQLEQLLATMDQVSRRVPGCERLRTEYVDLWVPGFAEDLTEEDLKDMRKALKRPVNRWIKNTNEREVNEVVKTLHPAARKFLRRIVWKNYRGFLAHDFEGMPHDFAAPTPFLVVNRNEGSQLALRKPIVRKYGQTTIKIQGTALKAEDGQTTFALLLLKNRKKVRVTDKNICFRTSLTEIAKTMLKGNPWHKDTRDAIWVSLERLRGCVITLTNAKGLRNLGGILDGAQELGEDSNLEIDIYLDCHFVELIEEGYVSLDPAVYFKLPPREANLYMYLMRQQTFNTKGYLKPVGIDKVHNAAGLGGLHPERKTKRDVRAALKMTLQGLKKKDIVRAFSIKDDKLKIHSESDEKNGGAEVGDGKQKTKPKTEDDKRCPHGYRFGKDFDQFEECQKCDLWFDCEDEAY